MIIALLKRTLAINAVVSLEKLQNHLHTCICFFDKVHERIWEWVSVYFYRQPSDGYMISRLYRMGIKSFRAYIYAQQKGRFGRRNFMPTDANTVVNTLRQQYPNTAEDIIAKASHLCKGQFNILNSATCDMRRHAKAKGWQLDWQKDPISLERYRKIFSHWRWDVFKMRPGQADIKGPWELTRCQHFVTLGQAYWLTKDEQYAQCFANTITDFILRNPPGFGIHWTCTMDVSLRIVGWLSGLTFFQGSKYLNYRWWRRFLKSLVEHGNFIVSNLEYGTWHGKLIVSNHGIADFFGLYWLALNFPQLDAACVWRGIAETALEQQIQAQILPDGGDFESSIPYHRLVVEMFLSAYALSLQAGIPLSTEYRDRLIKALVFIASLRQEDGRMPQIGDADDGRAHIFSGYGNDSFENMDHLLVAGSRVFQCPELAKNVDNSQNIESLFWNVQVDKSHVISQIPHSFIMPDFGVAGVRSEKSYLLMTNSRVGTNGIGNHKHNDQLAIEWVVGKEPFLVDGGSYIYTQNPEARNYFRSTKTHNTVMVDSEEQHGLNPTWLFRLDQCGDRTLELFESDLGTGIRGNHTAYERLSNPLKHCRRIFMDKEGVFVLEDFFESQGPHNLRWYFLIHPTIQVSFSEDQIVLQGKREVAILEAPLLNFKIEKGWYSPGYNKRHLTQALVSERTDLEKITLIGRPEQLKNKKTESILEKNDLFWSNHNHRVSS